MIKRYRSSQRNGERLDRLPDITWGEYSLDRRLIYIDPEKETGKPFIGFGGALTRSTQINLREMGKEEREKVLKAYYSKEEGIGYSLVRLTIGSTDFGEYSYDYLKEEGNLDSFDFAVEEEMLIPYLKEIGKIKGDLPLVFASTWSAPTYMKEGEERNFGRKLKADRRDDYARWVRMYLENLRKHDVECFALSIQNEPEAFQLWESTHITAEEEGEIIKNNFVPELKAHGFTPNIMIWDHNRDEVVRRSNVTLEDEEVDSLVWGIAHHWYVSNNYGNIGLAGHLHPDKHLIFTEGCVEFTNSADKSKADISEDLFGHAERYGRNIIGVLAQGTEAFMDWNMVLDEEGGPTWVGNYCGAPVTYDRNKKEVRFNPSFYYIGHFSKFIDKGAKLLYSGNDFESDVYSIAFKNPDGDIVLVVMNTDWLKEATLLVGDKRADICLAPRSITTFIIEKE